MTTWNCAVELSAKTGEPYADSPDAYPSGECGTPRAVGVVDCPHCRTERAPFRENGEGPVFDLVKGVDPGTNRDAIVPDVRANPLSGTTEVPDEVREQIMPKITKAGPSYFPEGVMIRATDDPRIAAVAREGGATVVDPGDREAHEVLRYGEQLNASEQNSERRRQQDERNDQRDARPDDAERDAAPFGETRTDRIRREQSESADSYPDSGTQTAAGEANWTRAKTRDER